MTRHTKIQNKPVRLSLALFSIAILSSFGCFEVVHYVGLNDANQIRVHWQFVMSNAMGAEMTKKKSGPSKSDNTAKNISKNVYRNADKMEAYLKKVAKNVSVKKFTNAYDMIQEVRFTAPAGSKIENFSGMPLFPVYNSRGKTLELDLSEMTGTNKKKVGKSKKEGGKSEKKSPKKESPQAKKMAALFLSTARYKLIMGGRFKNVRKAVLVIRNQRIKNAPKIIPLNVMNLGGVSVINFPFMSALAGLDKSNGETYLMVLRVHLN